MGVENTFSKSYAGDVGQKHGSPPGQLIPHTQISTRSEEHRLKRRFSTHGMATALAHGGTMSCKRYPTRPTIVDALDTLLIMELRDEYEEAREFVADIDWKSASPPVVNVFETTIRYVGGLLSAHDLSGDELFLQKAQDLTNLLMPAFDSPTGIPYMNVNFKTENPVRSGLRNGASVLADMGTLLLEFGHLSRRTGNQTYYQKAQRVIDYLDKLKTPYPGLYPIYINPDNGNFETAFITVGGGGDSFYEYLLKMYYYTKGTVPQYRTMFMRSVESVRNHLLVRTKENNTFLAVINGDKISGHMDELSCFLPGTLLLGSRLLSDPSLAQMATDLVHGCVHVWEAMPSGIAPESWNYLLPSQPQPIDATVIERAARWGFWQDSPGYLLRPETVESLFYFYRLTGDPSYQEIGWKLFQALNKCCRNENGFSGLQDVTKENPEQNNNQESFFFAETLKYFYLLFSPHDVIPLDKWVFNTEAHPFLI
ncbi:uncharacterized protein VTP21DRAFT_10896 [Calcarisporiella thermophila]|uniref:uncharacterized protein n=1 Tax=Calcarisporiella thermophila TaxID=911321 RepID=UPI00374270B9